VSSILAGVDTTPNEVACILVSYNSEPWLCAAIRSFRDARPTARVVVVDNGSADASVLVAESAGADVIRNCRNLGFARAVNQGMERLAEPYVLLLNPDAAMLPGSLDALVEAMRNCPTAAMAGPRLVGAGHEAITVGARRFSSARGRLLRLLPVLGSTRWARRDEYWGLLGCRDDFVEVDYLWGAALLVERSFVAECGGLDERFFLYGEDEDLGRQAHAAGRACLFVPGATSRHQGGGSSPDDDILPYARQLLACELIFEKWDSAPKAFAFSLAVVVLCFARVLVCVAVPSRLPREALRLRRVWTAVIGREWLNGGFRSG
jgi:N-acetylglucosaminyl-diphospho-decaprenol L-rhamnosyltransferase